MEGEAFKFDRTTDQERVQQFRTLTIVSHLILGDTTGGCRLPVS